MKPFNYVQTTDKHQITLEYLNIISKISNREQIMNSKYFEAI